MEPITQVLASVALARCGFRRVTPIALPIIVTAGLAPDLDWISVFGGARVFLEAHRTAADSLVGIVVLAAVIAAAFIPIGRRAGMIARKNLQTTPRNLCDLCRRLLRRSLGAGCTCCLI